MRSPPHSVSFGNVAFAPTKAQLGETEPIHDDRPYANLLYVKTRRASARAISRYLPTLISTSCFSSP